LHLDLPDGGSAELRAPDAIPRKQARHFRAVYGAIATPASEGVDAEDDPKTIANKAAANLLKSNMLVTIDDIADALVLCVVESWSYGEVTAEVLETLPDAVVTEINKAADSGGYVDKLMPDFSLSPDEDSPTGPSSD
jgi:hypothetical protein